MNFGMLCYKAYWPCALLLFVISSFSQHTTASAMSPLHSSLHVHWQTLRATYHPIAPARLLTTQQQQQQSHSSSSSNRCKSSARQESGKKHQQMIPQLPLSHIHKEQSPLAQNQNQPDP
jgi:hypothetical protein